MGFNSERTPDKGPVGHAEAASPSLDPQGGAARGQSDEINGGAEGKAGVDGQLPEGVRLDGVGIGFTLPKGLVLHEGDGATLSTEFATGVTAEVSRGALSFGLSPHVHINATWPATDMNLTHLAWDFASGTPQVHLYADSDSWGFLDYSDRAREALGGRLRDAVQGTAMAQAGYDPFQDPDLLGTLRAVGANFSRGPTVGEKADDAEGPGAEDAQRLRAHARFTLERGYEHEGLSVDPGAAVKVTVQGGGSAAQVQGAQGTQGMLQAAAPEQVIIESEGIHVRAGEDRAAQLQRVVINRGGAVDVQRFNLEGDAAGMSGLEAFVRLLGGAAALAGRGVPGEAALNIAARSPGTAPTVVPGLAEDKIERGLTEAVRALLTEHAHAIPGVDLQAIFGG
ncbi:MAG: hypothetical protein KC613_11945 [Myxococcales bacterium]|nr:hypothetical protein [Myxococcales bacterium]MCB9526312.1 hypothetical protein [Myxococcales bacterium]